MAIAVVGSVGFTGGTASAGIGTTGANLLLACVATTNNVTPVFNDSKGNAWNCIAFWSAGSQRLSVFACAPTTVGAGHTFTCGTSNFPSGWVLALSGASPLIDVGKFTVNATNSSVTSRAIPSVTPAFDDALLLAAITFGNSVSAVSVDSGMTTIGFQNFSGGNYMGSFAAYLIQTTAAAIGPTISWTASSSAPPAGMITIYPDGLGYGGGGGGLLVGGGMTGGFHRT